MLIQLSKLINNEKKTCGFLLFLCIYGILLFPIAVLVQDGMVIGVMALILVIVASAKWLTTGGIISALWASVVIIGNFLVAPYHMLGSMVIFFTTGIVVGALAKKLHDHHLQLVLKNEALIWEKKHLEALFRNSLDAIVFLDKNYLIVDANQHFIQLFGYERESILGKELDYVIQMREKGIDDGTLKKQMLENGEQFLVESTCYNKDSKVIEVLIKGVPIIIDNVIVGGYAIYDDITNRKYYEKQLKYLSFHDQLTDINNRLFFEQNIDQVTSKNEYPISIITADLNGLKLINDTMGHYKGDELLKATANVLKNAVRNTDLVFRIGGDEFAIILPLTDEKNCEIMVNQIRSAIKEYNKDNKETQTQISISIGMATAKNDEISLKEVFKRADDLMYGEKLYQSASVRAQLINTLMAALSERDHITEGHAQRLAEMSLLIGEKSGLPPNRFGSLTLLAQVHDIGKVGIPDSILHKTGPLTDEEWKIMRQHSEKGYRIALASPDLSSIADLILKHHEKWDGTGYPLGIKGEEIPLECRIISIVDAFDAMTNDRPYRKAKSKEVAIEEIKKCAGTQFDPTLVEIFLEVVQS